MNHREKLFAEWRPRSQRLCQHGKMQRLAWRIEPRQERVNIRFITVRISVRRTMCAGRRTSLGRERPESRMLCSDEVAEERLQHPSRLIIRHDPNPNP